MIEEMKTLEASEYVQMLTDRLARDFNAVGAPPVIFQILGTGASRRTHLKIPQASVEAVMLCVASIRQEGIFCHPVLAPLDSHEVE